MFIIALLLIREPPGEFNDLLRSALGNTTATVDDGVLLWSLPLLCSATDLSPPTFCLLGSEVGWSRQAQDSSRSPL